MKNRAVRKADLLDMKDINQVIQSAIMNWPMPDRVKRLSVPVMRYSEHDLKFYEVFVATIHAEVIGVAAWDAAPNKSLPNGKGGLFHGLYVAPAVQGQGVGKSLMDAVFKDARTRNISGLLIRAQRVSRNFFEHHQMQPLATNDHEYPCQYWKKTHLASLCAHGGDRWSRPAI